MKKSLLFQALAFVLCFINTLSFGKYSGGTGEPSYPYLISTPENLNTLSIESNDWDKHFLVVANINMAGYKYSRALIAPDISAHDDVFSGTSFTGVFDGNGHKIKNLTIEPSNVGYLGLFGKIEGSDAVVKNLSIVDVSITGGSDSWYLGGLCGLNKNGSIINCYSTGEVSGNTSWFLGGLCGHNYGIINNCNSTVDVTSEDYYLGGLCGVNSGNITNSYATGIIVCGDRAGGLCGENYGTIMNCYSTSAVSGRNSSDYLGGLCGWNENGSIINCHSTGAVSGSDYLGGLCGYNYGVIKNCYSTSAVSGVYNASYSSFLGGLCGKNYTSISNCYSTGRITGDGWLGGLCGENQFGDITHCYFTGAVSGDRHLGGLCGDNDRGSIINCYLTGTVDGNDYIGGLCGWNYKGSIINCYTIGAVSGYEFRSGVVCGYDIAGSYTSNFWNTDINPDMNGIGNKDDPNVAGKTTAQMQTKSMFTNASWDFDDVWVINDGFGYPKHIWDRVNLVGWYEVDFVDFALLSSKWINDCPRQCHSCDIVEDGYIDFTDFAVIAKNWNTNDCGHCDGADLTGDSNVNAEDLFQFTACWLTPYDCLGSDINFSGQVDFLDLLILCENWLTE